MRQHLADAVNSQLVELSAADGHERIASVVSYAGAGTAVVGGLTLNEWGVIAGMLIGIAGLVLGWWYKRKHYRLAAKIAAVKYGVTED